LSIDGKEQTSLSIEGHSAICVQMKNFTVCRLRKIFTLG
jgi:hypothetical protein